MKIEFQIDNSVVENNESLLVLIINLKKEKNDSRNFNVMEKTK